MADVQDVLEEYWPVILGGAAVLAGAVWYARSNRLVTTAEPIVLQGQQVPYGELIAAQVQLEQSKVQASTALFGAVIQAESAERQAAAQREAVIAAMNAQLEMARIQAETQKEIARLQAQAQAQAAQAQAAAQQSSAIWAAIPAILGILFSRELTRFRALQRSIAGRRFLAGAVGVLQ